MGGAFVYVVENICQARTVIDNPHAGPLLYICRQDAVERKLMSLEPDMLQGSNRPPPRNEFRNLKFGS